MREDESWVEDIPILRNYGGFVSVVNLAKLLSGQGNLIDVLALVFFAILSAEGFVSYLRIKGRTEFHLIS